MIPPLSITAIVTGALIAAPGIAGLVKPDKTREVLTAFPRNRTAGILLTVLTLAYATWYMMTHRLPFLFLEQNKAVFYVANPVFAWLIIQHLEDLLAPRALGAALLLAADPILKSQQWHESDFRLILAVTAYAWIIAAMFLVVQPYRFRQWLEPAMQSPGRFKILALWNAVLGLLILTLGTLVF